MDTVGIGTEVSVPSKETVNSSMKMPHSVTMVTGVRGKTLVDFSMKNYLDHEGSLF